MEKINNKGFTLAEALVAMILIAVMAAGIITALMSTKRAITMPSNKEDIYLAIETSKSFLQSATTTATICNNDTFESALQETPDCATAIANNSSISSITAKCHDLACKAPPACQGNGDYFVYSVLNYDNLNANETKRTIKFYARCEGQNI